MENHISPLQDPLAQEDGPPIDWAALKRVTKGKSTRHSFEEAITGMGKEPLAANPDLTRLPLPDMDPTPKLKPYQAEGKRREPAWANLKRMAQEAGKEEKVLADRDEDARNPHSTTDANGITSLELYGESALEEKAGARAGDWGGQVENENLPPATDPEGGVGPNLARQLNWGNIKRAASSRVPLTPDQVDEAAADLDNALAEIESGSREDELTEEPVADWRALKKVLSSEASSTEGPAVGPEESVGVEKQNEPQFSGGEDLFSMVLREFRQLDSQIAELREENRSIRQSVEEIVEHKTSQEKVFDTLHSELQDYKNDFVYERLKPTIRSLLFLCDSIEQFDEEVEQLARPQVDARKRALSPHTVRENLAHFRDQLVEALQTCEVTLMADTEGNFNPAHHKAMGVAQVEEEEANTIQRVLRNGWLLNGHVLRPAEVVVGRSHAEGTDQGS